MDAFSWMFSAHMPERELFGVSFRSYSEFQCEVAYIAKEKNDGGSSEL